MMRYTDMLSCDAPILLGVRLRPLSLGAILHMQSNDCIFISPLKMQLFTGGSSAENLKRMNMVTLELLLAITICSMTHEDFNKLITEGLHIDKFWRKKLITFDGYMKQWAKAVTKLGRKKQVNLIEAIGIFNKYLENGFAASQLPYTMLQDDTPQSGTSDNWPHTVITGLCAEMNYTRQQVLDQPLNVSLMDYLKLAERNGLIHMENDAEQKLAEEVLRLEKYKQGIT